MRIISGKLRGVRLGNYDFNARPTTDFARESLFNILNNYFDFEQIKVLDLFAGTGSISFEFASRGSTYIVLVESDLKNFKYIHEIINKHNFTSIKPVKSDVFRYLQHSNIGTFDIIFADPPYDMNGIDKIPDLIFEKNLLNPEGWLILEHSKKYKFNHHPRFREMRNYGAVHFSFFI